MLKTVLPLLSHISETSFTKHLPMDMGFTFEGLQARTHSRKPGSTGTPFVPLSQRAGWEVLPDGASWSWTETPREPLGRTALFTIASLLIHEHGMSFHLFTSSLISFNNVLSF